MHHSISVCIALFNDQKYENQVQMVSDHNNTVLLRILEIQKEEEEKIKKNLDRKNYFNMDDDDSILRKNNLTIDFETTTWYAQFSNKLIFIGLEMQWMHWVKAVSDIKYTSIDVDKCWIHSCRKTIKPSKLVKYIAYALV